MKFVSFNVNGIRSRLHQLKLVQESHNPDVIALQETKVADDAFPMDDVRALGFADVQIYGQKGHYGVALLSKTAPASTVLGLPWRDADQQRRFVSATYEVGGSTVRVINGYFPQGENRSHPTKFTDKETFYADIGRFLRDYCRPEEALILAGDMNVAPDDADIAIGEDNQKRWLRSGKTSFLPEERDWLQALTTWGLCDTYAKLYETERLMSWFDYRSRGFERTPKRGLRIDLILASQHLCAKLSEAGVDHDIRGSEKPSDHCPIWAHFSL